MYAASSVTIGGVAGNGNHIGGNPHAGIALYARSAPAGQGTAFAGSALLGIVGAVAAIALGIWLGIQVFDAIAY